MFITASENNAWLLNIRGRDTKYTPIPYSYILIDKNKNIKFFCDLKKLSSTFKSHFKNVEFLDIKNCSKILSKIKKSKFIIDNSSCSYFFENIIRKNNRILNFQDPIYFFKAIKERQEIENIKKAHIFAKAVVDYLEREWELREEAIRQEQRKSGFLKRGSFIIKKWILRLRKRNIDFDGARDD